MDDVRSRFEAEVIPHLDAAYRFACWLSPSPADADDVVQEAFLRAFRGFDSLRGSNTRAWLLAIVRNCRATAFQQQKRRAYVPLPDEAEGHELIAVTPDPEDESIRRDQQRLLERVMATLPQEHREVLVLREVEDLNYREIASVLKIPIGTVMSRLARARAALRAGLPHETEGEPRAMR